MTADAGSSITLTVTASGDPSDITYVWKKNEVIIPGETSNTLILNDISGDDIGQYECIPSNSVGSHNSSIIQVNVNCEFLMAKGNKLEIFKIYFFIDPGFQVDSLEDTSVTIAPSAPSGYTCTPPIPQGELTTSGTLMISSGLDASAEGEYICVSNDINGRVVIQFDVVGMSQAQ